MNLPDLLSADADTPEPPLPMAEVQNLAYDLFGLSGRFVSLPSEKDHLFRVEDQSSNHFLLRLSGAGEPVSMLRFQAAALRHIEARDPELPVPRMCPSRSGSDIEVADISGRQYSARVLTYLAGVPLKNHRVSTELRRDVGRSLARLDLALEDRSFPQVLNNLLWDIRKAAGLRNLVRYVLDENARLVVDNTFEALERHVLPRISTFRDQVIHNDFNRKNILFALEAPNRVSGIIDFGDIISAPRVVDLGVAIARQIDSEGAVQAACDIAGGYCSLAPLEDDEINTLFWIICGRLALRVAIWSWRQWRADPRCDWADMDAALQLLLNLHAQGADAVTGAISVACRRSSGIH